MDYLHGYFLSATSQHSERVAVRELSGHEISYGALNDLTNRCRDRLIACGVKPGDRVGIVLRKSIDTVASILGIVKCGAAYVPVDATSPPSRNAFILSDCQTKVVVVDQALAGPLCDEMAALDHSPKILSIQCRPGGEGLSICLQALDEESFAHEAETYQPTPYDLAYILYTSGSTGKPKGVMISHRNATSFVDWCIDEFRPSSNDCFSSHAPFHFDLSILDLYTAQSAGATLVLVPEDVGKEPGRLAPLIAETGITVWYSAPSILSLMAVHEDLAKHDYSKLRLVLFAGEVFPIARLRKLKNLIPHPVYYNLYGPTETNVCTFYKLPKDISDREEPVPIGIVCPHLQGNLVAEDGSPTPKGEEGELCICGPSVLDGYWNLPEQYSKSFLHGAGSGKRYRTGDLVFEDKDGQLVFVGRRDRMVKKRGYRVELGEIEACLYRHPDVAEAAVVALQNDESGLRITAHLATPDGGRLSLIALKRFCSEHLPLYMIPDYFRFYDSLPKTSTDKTDYQTLASIS